MATDDADSWTTTSAFVASTTRDIFMTSTSGSHLTSTAATSDGSANIGTSLSFRRYLPSSSNTTASALIVGAVDDVTGLPVSTSGGDPEIPPGLLWLPYVIFTIVLFSLIALSFVRFHCQRGHQYRRRQAELSDKRPYRQLQQPTPDHLRLLGSETGSAGGSQPNGGLSGNYIPEQMNLFVQYSQVLPDDCYFTNIDENATAGAVRLSSKKNGNGGKRGGLNRRPLVFTFNSNGSMVDIRCEEDERTNTFRLMPNADSTAGDEQEVQEIDLGNGELDDLDPSALPGHVALTSPSPSSYSNRQLPVQYRSSGVINEQSRNSLNRLPPPPSAGNTSNRTVAPSVGGSNCGGVGGRERTTSGARYSSSNYSSATTTTTTAQSHPPTSSRYAEHNHLTPPTITELSTAVQDGPRPRSTPAHPSCSSPPPRPSTSSSSSTHKPPLATTAPLDQQRLHQQQQPPQPPPHLRRPTSPTPHHPHRHPQHHRLSSSSATSNFRPNHHGQHHRMHHSHRQGAHYLPLDASDRTRKDLYGSDDDEAGLNCAAEALLLWQKRV